MATKTKSKSVRGLSVKAMKRTKGGLLIGLNPLKAGVPGSLKLSPAALGAIQPCI